MMGEQRGGEGDIESEDEVDLLAVDNTGDAQEVGQLMDEGASASD